MSNNNLIYPNFLYIGASKSGSSWVFECLKEHPDVFIPNAKDIQFFDRYYNKGRNWYLSYFKKGKGKTAIGELSHDYFLFEGVAEKIHELLPDVKLIACLREPVDKIISSYKYAKTVYLDKAITFEDFFFNSNDIQAKSKFRDHNMVPKSASYYDNLSPFYKLFPKENILILFFDELKSNPDAFLEKIQSFIGVDPNFKPSLLHTKVLAASKPRSMIIAHLAYVVGGIVRKLGFANLVGIIKANKLFNKFLYNNSSTEFKVSEDTLEKVKEFYRKDFDKIETLIGTKLPDDWRK